MSGSDARFLPSLCASRNCSYSVGVLVARDLLRDVLRGDFWVTSWRVLPAVLDCLGDSLTPDVLREHGLLTSPTPVLSRGSDMTDGGPRRGDVDLSDEGDPLSDVLSALVVEGVSTFTPDAAATRLTASLREDRS